MAAAKHTLATNCRLAPVCRASSDIGCPPLDARFFYSSLIPIDDPLSSKPGASGYESKSSHRQLRPFGQGDNNALEKAWLGLYSETHRKQHLEARGGRDKMSTATGAAIEARRQLVSMLAARHLERHRAGSRSHNLPGAVGHLSGTMSASPCCPELMVDVSEELENKFCALVRKQLDELSPENLIHDVMMTMERLRKPAEDSAEMRSAAPKMVSPNRPKSQHSVETGYAGSKDTMIPVPPAVANQLEAGYQELRPWTETWADELRCAIEGQEQKQDEAEPTISSNPFCAARCCQGEAATQGANNPTMERPPREAPNRPFANYHVIYKDKSDAYLLKQSLKPSAYYGRKPVAKIMRGIAIGIPVTRGFDQQTWDSGKRQARPPETPLAEDGPESAATAVCSACKADASRGQINDLVLVAHGIGQKFAERVESFHFTHAINAFRRAVNTDMASPSIQAVVRKGQTGLMILPLNWRMGLSFEDGGPLQQGDVTASFALKDIEPGTIPAVRSIMSDVMFDIPFYMSHHKGKMIEALVSEANRVYRLWCTNNPGFAETGRVHLIAHSLGSVMALDVLSHQPTMVPRLDLTREPSSRHFEFDTKNLFLLGSPAAFFLLLERKALVPRRGRRKPGADAADTVTKNVVGDAGTMGCLAVDNIYNVLAKEDPVAYLLNGAVDAKFSASLKTAYVPSTSTSFLKSVTDAVRNVVPGLAPASATALDRPPTMRLPSQLELEVHDFTREEVAEKKAFLLNDNGQIDWVLRSGGGPLELQYLNMLSAHTSYWTSQDFIRMLCIEIGREPGRASSLPAMRAVKAAKRFTQ
ncbi:hypothetical protein CDD80_2108 [Ophiocordyceps camponoti-rufipedis]|uniref:DDHD domain-containing protein n=1 Tax=Ophiocordyceps camponoti-rufipedis TaxID=2004952 RepID=A0A2C5ZMQ9_9HYPO|nr:hypothetical protein CDD80_2108 [Ophiocordyceps camponoti-rufipedis]